MLCATCVSIFDREPGTTVSTTISGQHHASLANVEAAAAQGCYLCSELALAYEHDDGTANTASFSFELKTYSIVSPSGRLAVLNFDSSDGLLASAGYEIVYTEDIVKPPGYDTYLQQTRKDVVEEPWRVRDDGFPSSSARVSGWTGDADVLKIADRWLKTCLQTHSQCDASSNKSWYPRRLLDLSAPEGQRLVITDQEKPVSRYATLSHCWGPNASICCLTSHNLEDFKKDIPSNLLTNTFRDAISATRMLNIRYLWIDSLCIMQAGEGSKEDWEEHAIAMRLVYSHSLVNIAAARAESGADGAFATRSDTFLRPCHVRWRRPSNVQDTKEDSFWTIRRAEHHQSQSLRTSPLYTRGWVVQERFLAPRVLHFGIDRVYWECAELGLVEESFPAGFKNSCPEYDTNVSWAFDLVNKSSNATDDQVIDRADDRQIRSRWLDTISGYTGCDLSFPDKDIFFAIAGIAEKFGQHFDHQYAAGLFRQHLPFDLLWQNKGERSEEYRAPSWSWASIDGQVQFTADECPYCDICCNRFADVKDLQVELANKEVVYGPVKQAALTLTGYLWPCRIEPAQQGGTGLRQRVDIHWCANSLDKPPAGLLPKRAPSYWQHTTSGGKYSKRSLLPHGESIVHGEADIDDEEDSIAGFLTESEFNAWAVPIMEFKTPRDSHYSTHWGLLVKKTGDGEFQRLGIYRVHDVIMDQYEAEKRWDKQDIRIV